MSVIADLVMADRHVAVGAASPIAAGGVMLARELNGGHTRLSLLGSAEHNPFTDGGRELFDCAAQGRIDTFFLSGAQIDGAGNVNLLGTGPKADLSRRYSGNFGAPFMIYTVPKIIFFRLPHNRQSLVDKVDYVSAAGQSDPGIWRRGGPRYLITDRCLFDFAGGFHLQSVHPGEDLKAIIEHTGFTFTHGDEPPVTEVPDQARLALIRGPILAALAETYPNYAASMK